MWKIIFGLLGLSLGAVIGFFVGITAYWIAGAALGAVIGAAVGAVAGACAGEVFDNKARKSPGAWSMIIGSFLFLAAVAAVLLLLWVGW